MLRAATSFDSSITIGTNSQLAEFISFNDLCNKTLILDGSGITYENGLMYNTNNKTVLGATADFDGTIPTGCTTIGNYFLYSNTSFNNTIAIPSTVTTIGHNFLQGCTAFNKPITIPSTITTIGNYFLSGCTTFNSAITIDAGVERIGSSFMEECSSFNQSLTIPNTVTTINNRFMYNARAFNSTLILSNSLKYIYDSFLYNAAAFNQPISIPDNVESIGAYFLQNVSLTNSFNSKITFGTQSKLKSIGGNFLYSNKVFNQDIVIPAGVTTIGNNFMYYWTAFANTIDFSLISDPSKLTLGSSMAISVPETNTITFKVASGTTAAWQAKLLTATGKSTWPAAWTITEA